MHTTLEDLEKIQTDIIFELIGKTEQLQVTAEQLSSVAFQTEFLEVLNYWHERLLLLKHIMDYII